MHDRDARTVALLRAAVDAQLALWETLRALEDAIGEGSPSVDDLVQALAIGCDGSATEWSDDQIAEMLASTLPREARSQSQP